MGVKVPRVTVQIDYGDDAHFGELSVISVGYGIHQAWIYSTMFDTGSIFGVAPLHNTSSEQAYLAYFVSLAFFALMLLIASALDTRLIKPLHATPVIAASAALCTVGTLVLFLSAYAAVVEIISGVLTGIGSTALLLAWGINFSRRDLSSIAINGAFAIVIGFTVYAFVLHQIPVPFSGIISALIPVAEAAILVRIKKSVPSMTSRALMFAPLPINHAKFVFRFGLPVFLFGIALGIMRQTSIQSVLLGDTLSSQMAIFLAACCATLLVLVTLLALGGNERWNAFFRPLVPLIAVLTVVVSFVHGTNPAMATGIMLVSYMTLEALMWIFFGEIAQRFRLSPIFVFGLGRGLMAVAALAGTLVPLIGIDVVTSSPFGDGTISLALIVLMMVGYALLPDEREIANIVVFDKKKAAAIENLQRDHTDVGEGAVELDAGANVAESGANDARSALVVTRNEVRTVKASVGAGVDASPNANTRLNSNASASTENERLDFRMRCENIANTYLLSKREAEVMFYLARGFNSQYIQEKLYISEGTAKTHIRHIYRKINVHSQQELMRLVESVEL